jgi:hypothetical protein
MAAASVQAELDTLPFAQPQESSPRAAAPAWQVAPDGTALRPDQANLARQLTWPAPDAPTLARMWRDMVNHYGAQLVGREQGARGGLLPAMLLQSGQDPRRLRGQVDDNPAADAWRFTVRPNGRDAHRLRVVQGDPEPVLGRRRRVRAALRLELVLLDGTVVTVQAEPYALGVRMESCAPDRASADRLRALQPQLQGAIERAGLQVLSWRYRDTLPQGRAHARLPSIEAASMLRLPVFQALAEVALTLPLHG